MKKDFLVPLLLALANAGYLTYQYIYGFFRGGNTATLATHFTLPILSVPFFFLFLLLLQNTKRKTYNYKGTYAKSNRVLRFGFYAILILFTGVFGLLLFKQATQNGGRDLNIVLPVFAEVIGLLWLTAANKETKVKRQLLLGGLWTLSILAGFIAIGIAEKLTVPRYTNEERLIFSGIFFHSTNTVYLVWQARSFWSLSTASDRKGNS